MRELIVALPGIALIAAMFLLGAWHHGWLRGYEHRKRHEAEMRALRTTEQHSPAQQKKED